MACQDPVSCPDGNCIGCRNGQLWCQDPRCVGLCTDCGYDEDRDRFGYVVFFLIIVSLVLVVVIICLTYGHQMVYYYVPNYQLQQKGYVVPNGPPIYT